MINVLIADDHPVFVEGLKNVLPLKDQLISVVATAVDGEQAFHRWQAVHPDVTLMDIRMPNVDGIGAAKRIREKDPDARIIVLTTFDDYDLIAAALSVGVQGFLLKDSDPGEIADAILRVVEGTFVVSLQISRRIQKRQNESDDDRVVEDPFRSLTARERQVLFRVAQGQTNGMIADDLGIRDKTVRNYIAKIYDVLDVHNRTQLALWVQDLLKSDQDA